MEDAHTAILYECRRMVRLGLPVPTQRIISDLWGVCEEDGAATLLMYLVFEEAMRQAVRESQLVPA